MRVRKQVSLSEEVIKIIEEWGERHYIKSFSTALEMKIAVNEHTNNHDDEVKSATIRIYVATLLATDLGFPLQRDWLIKQISQVVGVSIGYASTVLKRIQEDGFIKIEDSLVWHNASE